ncbi:MAG: sterol-binding protein [Burkholderiales bacterium]|nr:sterol-binding protein [Burkholderiales bacterium]
MLTLPAIFAINHLLAAESWARNALIPHCGKSARLCLPPMDIDITVLPDGSIAAAEGVPETRIKANPSALLRTLNGEMAEVELSGDIEFAKTIGFLLRNLKWDFEGDLGRFTGDILAHRMAGAANSFFSWQKAALWNLSGNLAEYWTEERPLLAKAADVSKFVADTDKIRDDTERLEKRIERLALRDRNS